MLGTNPIGFAAPGVIWMLALTGTSFNLMAQIGILILMGIVVNNGIVLLDYVNQLRISGLGREEAIIQAGRERLRPILMTAATTVIGLLPLAIRGPAAGGIFYYPLARTVMGGQRYSTKRSKERRCPRESRSTDGNSLYRWGGTAFLFPPRSPTSAGPSLVGTGATIGGESIERTWSPTATGYRIVG